MRVETHIPSAANEMKLQAKVTTNSAKEKRKDKLKPDTLCFILFIHKNLLIDRRLSTNKNTAISNCMKDNGVSKML